MTENKYQLIIIGAGPAGMTAGIYAGRSGLKTLVLDKTGYGGQMLLIDKIENYPGMVKAIGGFELAKNIYDQMMQFGVEHRTDEVKEFKKSGDQYEVVCPEGNYTAESVILAMGARPKFLGIPGESKLRGKGVSYCAVCDGNFFKGKKVFVVGGGNTALGEAEYLSRIVSGVTVIHRRDEFRGDNILQERVKKNKKVSLMLSSVVESINGKDKVESITVKNLKSAKSDKIAADGIFVFVGQVPQTEFVKGNINMDEKGFIVTDKRLTTSLEGVYACGDCARAEFWQLVTACAEGAEAAHYAAEFLLK